MLPDQDLPSAMIQDQANPFAMLLRRSGRIAARSGKVPEFESDTLGFLGRIAAIDLGAVFEAE